MGIRPFSYGKFGFVPDPPEPPENLEDKLNVGDLIKCKDKDDMAEAYQELAKAGYDCEFVYEYDGQKGLWLEVIAIESEGG